MIIMPAPDHPHLNKMERLLILAITKNIMAPIITVLDFSSASLNAARYAADMAAAIHAPLVLVHVVQIAELCLTLDNDEIETYKAEKRPDAQLTELKKHFELRTGNKIQVDKVILHGEPENELEKFCGKNRPRAVVTGLNIYLDKSPHQYKNNVIDFVHAVDCPLFIIPFNASFCDFRNIAVMIGSGENPNGAAVSQIKKWVKLFVSGSAASNIDIKIWPFSKHTIVDLIVLEKPDLLVDACGKEESIEYLLQNIQRNHLSIEQTPAILSLRPDDVKASSLSIPVFEEKKHDCRVCNGACKSKKPV